MTEPVTDSQLLSAFQQVRAELLAQRNAAGHWTGKLAGSALSTATAISALCIVARAQAAKDSGSDWRQVPLTDARQSREQTHSAGTAPWLHYVEKGIEYLLRTQNPDGGWGDTDQSLSNIATTMLVRAALHLAGRQSPCGAVLERAEAYIRQAGGIEGLRKRYGRDKTFVVPILSNCALAGLVPWNDVSQLPFEFACLPQSWYRFARLPVVSYAIPALIAIGQGRFHFRPSYNPITWPVRRISQGRSRNVLRNMQPKSGGYLEATPLTSFVVMNMAAIGQHELPVVRDGVQFLLNSARGDGSWPIDTNLATWVTTLSLNAILPSLSEPARQGIWRECGPWLLNCQHVVRHPFTGASPGGWGWTDLSGAVPDGDDTPGALLALLALFQESAEWPDAPLSSRDVLSAACLGIRWLLDLQNRNGGWPTFCRGWGKLPFDRSSTDLTAHALRALSAWSLCIEKLAQTGNSTDFAAQLREFEPVLRRIQTAMKRGLKYLERQQRPDGAWIPTWFGNQFDPNEENPIYGTSRIIMALRDLGLLNTNMTQRGVQWLESVQRTDGSFGSAAPSPIDREPETGSVEETAVASEALLSGQCHLKIPSSAENSLRWLINQVSTNCHRRTSPVGFYFAKLWYYEHLYPLAFTASALRHWVESRGLLKSAEL